MRQDKKIDIVIKPWLNEEAYFLHCDVIMQLELDNLREGDMLVAMCQEVAWVPGATLAEPGLAAKDIRGKIELKQSVEKISSNVSQKVWRVCRDTEGRITVSYRFLPRDVSGIYRCHPLFDTIQEENGTLICGMTTLAAPMMESYHIVIRWDKTEMPEGTDIVTLRGEGDLSFTGIPADYLSMYIMVGRVKRAIAPNETCGVYWLDDKLPDVERVREQIPALLDAVSSYFHAENVSFRIFFRKEPFEISNSGTAFSGGFAYGYSDKMPLDMDKGLNVMAHEMVHNWTKMKNIHGEGAWFNEGMAEYFSLWIPLEKGIVSADKVAKWLTEKSTGYYNNPYQNLSLEEANQRTWADSSNIVMQKVPYGRGLFYFAEIDLQMKEKYNGRKSIMDIIFPLLEISADGTYITEMDWENVIERELGFEAVTEFRSMKAGRFITANENWFDGIFTYDIGTFCDIKNGSYENALIWRVR